MNAIKFIKEHGVDKAREVVSGAPDGATHLSNDTRHYVNADFKPINIMTAYRDWETDRKSTRLNSSHLKLPRMPSSA